MRNTYRVLVAVAALGLVAAVPMAAAAQDEPLTFYVVTHGATNDPYWILVNEAATQAGEDLGVQVNVSFAANDVAVALCHVVHGSLSGNGLKNFDLRN